MASTELIKKAVMVRKMSLEVGGVISILIMIFIMINHQTQMMKGRYFSFDIRKVIQRID